MTSKIDTIDGGLSYLQDPGFPTYDVPYMVAGYHWLPRGYHWLPLRLPAGYHVAITGYQSGYQWNLTGDMSTGQMLLAIYRSKWYLLL